MRDRTRYAVKVFFVETIVLSMTASILVGLPVIFFTETEGSKWGGILVLVFLMTFIFIIRGLILLLRNVRRINRFTEFEYQRHGKAPEYMNGRELWDAMIIYEKEYLDKTYNG